MYIAPRRWCRRGELHPYPTPRRDRLLRCGQLAARGRHVAHTAQRPAIVSPAAGRTMPSLSNNGPGVAGTSRTAATGHTAAMPVGLVGLVGLVERTFVRDSLNTWR